jgi:hypothetical protein
MDECPQRLNQLLIEFVQQAVLAEGAAVAQSQQQAQAQQEQ